MAASPLSHDEGSRTSSGAVLGPVVTAPAAAGATCTGCGHGRQAHTHYRRGTDCALCTCAKYSRSLLGRLLGR